MGQRAIGWACLLFGGLAAVFAPGQAAAQVAPGQFELSDSVYLDEIDSATRAHLERVKAFVADRQWDEAVETLRRVMATQGQKVVAVSPVRYLQLVDFCHLQIATLPDEALALYRDRVDPVAAKWYEEAVAQRDAGRLRQIVDEMFCSTWGDDALWALGEIALERGEFAAARGYWETLLKQPPAVVSAEQYRHATEHGQLNAEDFELLTQWYQRNTAVEPPLYELRQDPPPEDQQSAALVRLWSRLGVAPTRLAYPDTNIDLAEIRARLILLSILEGNLDRARQEVATYTKAYPDAAGRLAGRQTNFSRGLATLLTAAEKWPTAAPGNEWYTFAGNFARNGIAAGVDEIGAPAWKAPLPLGETLSTEGAGSRIFSFRRVGEDAAALLSYHPVVAGDLVLWCNHRYVYAFNLKTGEPAWKDPSRPPGVIYDHEAVDSHPGMFSQSLGVPRFTLTVHGNKVYARMGSQVTTQRLEQIYDVRTSQLVCLDLAAEGRLVWKITAESDRWSFEGPPVVEGPNVYVAMRRSDVRPQAYVACLDAETGRQQWRTLVCAAETPGGGQKDEITHNLLTLNEGVLYLNTNLGAIAALSAYDGRVKWVSLYPRARNVAAEGTSRRADHYYRDLNPCVYHQGLVYAAPSDSQSIVALDANTGQLAWETPLVHDAVHLLGVTHGLLVASGNKLWWIDAQGGRIRADWPGTSPLGMGRGVLAGDQVLWTSRDTLFSFNMPRTGETTPTMHRAPFKLTPYEATGGNLVMAGDRLLLATASQLFAFRVRAVQAAATEPE